MRRDRVNANWALAAIPLLAVCWSVATLTAALAAGPVAPSPSTDLSRNQCELYPYTVICESNFVPGGTVGCFDTLCDAVAAGAYHCRRTTSACEPH